MILYFIINLPPTYPPQSHLDLHCSLLSSIEEICASVDTPEKLRLEFISQFDGIEELSGPFQDPGFNDEITKWYAGISIPAYAAFPGETTCAKEWLTVTGTWDDRANAALPTRNSGSVTYELQIDCVHDSYNKASDLKSAGTNSKVCAIYHIRGNIPHEVCYQHSGSVTWGSVCPGEYDTTREGSGAFRIALRPDAEVYKVDLVMHGGDAIVADRFRLRRDSAVIRQWGTVQENTNSNNGGAFCLTNWVNHECFRSFSPRLSAVETPYLGVTLNVGNSVAQTIPVGTPYKSLARGGVNYAVPYCQDELLRRLDQVQTTWNGNDHGDETLNSVACNSVSYAAANEFVIEFDKLYEGRNKTIYPQINPMRRNPNTPIYTVPPSDFSALGRARFPESYVFSQTEHGVMSLRGTKFVSKSLSCMTNLQFACCFLY